MAVSRIIPPFLAGVAVGALLHKYWPDITEAGRPLLRTSLRGGANLLEKGRTAFWEQSERFTDLVEEIREEDAAAAQGGEQGGPAAKGAAKVPPTGSGGE